MDVYWLEQRESDVPVDNGWLCPAEALHLQIMRFPKRGAEWRLGRWTAKLAIATYFKLSADLRGIEVRAAPSGAPEAYFADGPPHLSAFGSRGSRIAVSLSLSHSNGVALCALAPPGALLGCDLEAIEPRSDNFLADYFTPEEQALVKRAPAAERFQLMALLWSAKESALKALSTGLRRDTRSVVVILGDGLVAAPGQWRRLQVRCSGGPIFEGWCRHDRIRVWTLVAAPAPFLPTWLEIAAAPVLP